MTDTSLPDQRYPLQEKKMQDWLYAELSLWIAAFMGARPNRCFDNAWRLFIRFLPELFCPHGKFIEGWLVVELEHEVVTNEHGWCELPDGTIIDPSILLLVPLEQPVFYFPGVTRSCQEVEAIVREEAWFPHVRFDGKHGEDGLGHPAYKVAHDAARQKMAALAHATHPPKKQVFFTAQDLDHDQQETTHRTQIIIVLCDEPEKN